MDKQLEIIVSNCMNLYDQHWRGELETYLRLALPRLVAASHVKPVKEASIATQQDQFALDNVPWIEGGTPTS